MEDKLEIMLAIVNSGETPPKKGLTRLTRAQYNFLKVLITNKYWKQVNPIMIVYIRYIVAKNGYNSQIEKNILVYIRRRYIHEVKQNNEKAIIYWRA